MNWIDVTLGEQVRVFDVNDKRRDLSGEGRPGEVTRVGRTLFDVRYDGPWHGKAGIQTFRKEGGHSNDAYGHQYVKTLGQAALDAREEIAVKVLLQHGLSFSSTGRRQLVTTEQLEAIAVVVGHVRESATPLALDGGPNLLEGVCACGVLYTVIPGPGEGERLDKAHAEHVASVAERVKNFGLKILGA